MSYPALYPLSAFHLIVGNAADEVCRHVQAPEALVGMAFLSTLSIACQGLIDVQLPTGQVRPVSLYLMVVADSGERKTAVDNLVAAPVYAFDQECSKQFEAALADYNTQHCAWNAITAGLRRKLIKAAQDGVKQEEVQRHLEKHLDTEPAKPRRRRLVRQSATDRAVMDALEGEGESLGFISDEGEIILKGGAMGQLGRLNKAWDGAREIVIDRANDETVTARDPRVTVALMLQLAVLRAYMERHGAVARGSGYLARNLIAWPTSKQGFRFVYSLENTWLHLPVFHSRVRELLDEYRSRIATGPIERTIVEFSDEAKAQWIVEANRIEQAIQPWGCFKDVQDFASKSLEICGRIAALLHWFSRQDGKISVDTFGRALQFTNWHLCEFKRVFSPQYEIAQGQSDAQVLSDYLRTRYFSFGQLIVAKNLVLKNGPVRPVQRMRVALDLLVAQGQIWIWRDLKRKSYIRCDPYPYSHVGQVLGSI